MSVCIMQAVVRVCDGPGLCDEQTVTFNIRRSFFAPLWNSQRYDVTIGEDQPVFSIIINVEARDQDLAPPYNQFTYR